MLGGGLQRWGRKNRVQEGWSVGTDPRKVKSLGIEKVLIFTQGIPNGIRI